MYTSYSTHLLPQQDRQSYWKEVVEQAYFPLEVNFANPKQFHGSLSQLQLDKLGISYLASSSICFEREQHQISDESEPYFLITLPLNKQVNFSQASHSVCCQPDGFILERSDLPYRFSYDGDNALWVVRVPVSELKSKIRDPERYLYMQFDRRQGVGAMFFDYLQSVVRQAFYTDAISSAVLNNQLIDLLALSLKNDDRVLMSHEEGIRRAHLVNIEVFVRDNLSRAELSPNMIAAACNISTRYLHKLFKESDQTVSQWIKELRLQAALSDIKTQKTTTLAEIAYRWGFNDQAHFCRLFKARFNCTPKEMRHSH